MGLAPDFEVSLKTKKAITHYKIVADKKMITEQVDRMRKQFGKIESQAETAAGHEVNGTFTNEEEEISNKAVVELDQIKSKKALNSLLGKKVGDEVVIKEQRSF